MPQRARLGTMGLLPASFWTAWDAVVIWAIDLGLPGLAVLSFTEAFVQPIPPEALTLPMFNAAQGDPLMIFLIWLVATVTSVAGAVVGWWLGRRLGRGVADRFIANRHVRRLETLTRRYGEMGVFIAALSPIPYKVLAWVAGMGEMDRTRFIYAGLLGRGLRFGIEAIVIGIWGPELFALLNDWWVWVIVSALGIVLFIPAKRWWDGLLDEEE
jgi:membrane protein YqaA with SNARE-associated domain